MSTFIPNEKRTKSDMQKTWKGIFIDYTEILKHLRVWTPHTHQVLIANKSVVNKSKKNIDLLIEYLLLLPKKSLQPQTGKPKLRTRLCKNVLEKYPATKLIEGGKTSKRTCMEDVTEKYNKDKLAQAIIQTKRMRIYIFCDLKLKTDLGIIPGKNHLRNGLVRPVYKFAKSVTETNSKVRKPKTYNKAMNGPIHRNKRREAVNEEL